MTSWGTRIRHVRTSSALSTPTAARLDAWGRLDGKTIILDTTVGDHRTCTLRFALNPQGFPLDIEYLYE